MKPLIVANWKMNLSLSDTLILAGQAAKVAENLKNISVVLAPPAVYLYPVREHLKARPNNLFFAAQDVFYEKEGSFTGEISPLMVKNICAYCIVGHSERRKYFGETDEIISRKIKALIDVGIKPIVCFGEQERYHLEDHFDYEVKRMKKAGGLLDSVDKVLKGISKDDLEKIVIAYEPVWAIGTGNCASGAYASAVCYIIKSFIEEKFPHSDEIQLLYGGSIDSETSQEFMSQPNIQGLLVGSASLVSAQFKKICQIASREKQR